MRGEEQACQGALTRKRTLWGTAAHLSSLSTLFPLTQLAMMMAEATPSPLRERSIFSVGFVPLSSSIGSAPPSTLPRGEACSECQRALTGRRTLRAGSSARRCVLEGLQRGVAPEALGESGGSVRAELVV